MIPRNLSGIWESQNFAHLTYNDNIRFTLWVSSTTNNCTLSESRENNPPRIIAEGQLTIGQSRTDNIDNFIIQISSSRYNCRMYISATPSSFILETNEGQSRYFQKTR